MRAREAEGREDAFEDSSAAAVTGNDGNNNNVQDNDDDDDDDTRCCAAAAAAASDAVACCESFITVHSNAAEDGIAAIDDVIDSNDMWYNDMDHCLHWDCLCDDPFNHDDMEIDPLSAVNMGHRTIFIIN